MKRLFTIALSIFVALAAGCAASPQSKFYTLGSTGTASAPVVNCAVSVGPVSIPAVVDRPQIVIRTGPNQVAFDEFNRWASPLKGDIARIVSEDLSAMLGTRQVTVFPQATVPDGSYRVQIDVLRLDSEPDKTATLDAAWTVTSPKDRKMPRSGRTTVTEPVSGRTTADLVAAHSRALGRLSAGIAVAIRELEAPKK